MNVIDFSDIQKHRKAPNKPKGLPMQKAKKPAPKPQRDPYEDDYLALIRVSAIGRNCNAPIGEKILEFVRREYHALTASAASK